MKLGRHHLWIGPRYHTYWWGGSIGSDAVNGWWPTWYVEWGGKGYDPWGAPLLAVLIPLWGERKIHFRVDLPRRRGEWAGS